MEGEIKVNITNQVGEIIFHHPKSNSLPSNLLLGLINEIKSLSANNSCAVIKLTSKGTTFCAGASLNELLAIENDKQATDFFSGFGFLIEAIKNCPKFVIAEVNGKAVGGGVGIIAACDYVVALDSASIKLSELSIGFGPFVIAPSVIRKIGVTAFSSLTIDSENWKTAEWCFNKGLYNHLAYNQEELSKKTSELCNTLASYSKQAMKEIKKMLWEGTDNLENIHKKRAELSGSLSQSSQAQSILSKLKKSI